MISRDMFFTHTVDIEEIDLGTMAALSDADYRSYARDCMLHVDHHETLRFDVTGSGLATTREQLDILIEELQALRHQLKPRKA